MADYWLTIKIGMEKRDVTTEPPGALVSPQCDGTILDKLPSSDQGGHSN